MSDSTSEAIFHTVVRAFATLEVNDDTLRAFHAIWAATEDLDFFPGDLDQDVELARWGVARGKLRRRHKDDGYEHCVYCARSLPTGEDCVRMEYRIGKRWV